MNEQDRVAEMARGRQIGERAKRQSDLARYIQGKKVKVMVALPGHPHWEDRGRVNIFYVDGVEIAHQNEIEDDYPNDPVMAVIAMAVGATLGFDGIPPADPGINSAERKRRDEYRQHLGQWKAHFDKPKPKT